MYQELCSKENLHLAFRNARKGKTKKHYVKKFEKNLEYSLSKLRKELTREDYLPSPLKVFIIKDPKTRKISKSRFRDRIVHHAVINVIGGIFQKRFIYDSHANQKGKGTLKAIQRFNKFKLKVSKNNTKNCYVLKADIKHYFQEISHAKLIDILMEDIKDAKVIKLVLKILYNGSSSEFKGMPLGNFTSQFFANVYLNELDQFVKHNLGAKYYIRYVDDFVIFNESKEKLLQWKIEIEGFLDKNLKLELHQQKSRILDLKRGITFLGFRIFPKHILIRKSNINKFKRRLNIARVLYGEGRVSRNKVVEILEGWMSYSKHASTFKHRTRLIKKFNREFPIGGDRKLLNNSKKTANFLRKLDHSKLEFSIQKTLYLLTKKKLKPQQIASFRKVKESTVWKHISKLIEHGQLPIWDLLKKRKIVRILAKINSSKDSLKEIRGRLNNEISYDYINCVLAHVKFKERICRKS